MPRMVLKRLLCVVGVILFGLCLTASARVWTTKDGQSFEGQLVKYSNGTAIIKKAKGGKVLFSIEKFSEADQAYLREKYPSGDRKKTTKKTPPPAPKAQSNTKPIPQSTQVQPQVKHQQKQPASGPNLFRSYTLNNGDKALPLSGQYPGSPERVKLDELRGKVVLIQFWSYHNKYCMNHLPYLVKLYETYKGRGFEIIGLTVPFERKGISRPALNNVKKKFGMNWLISFDSHLEISKRWGLKHPPTYMLIDPNGFIANNGMSVKEIEKEMAVYFKQR